MDKQLIERLAQEASFSVVGEGGTEAGERIGLRLQAFAALVAEECAKVALSVPIESFATIQHRNQVHYQRETTAIAIRAAFPKEQA